MRLPVGYQGRSNQGMEGDAAGEFWWKTVSFSVLPMPIYKRNKFRKKRSLRFLRAFQGMGNVGPTISYTDIGQERGRRVMSSSGTSHVTELSVFWAFRAFFGEPQVCFV